MKRCSKCKTEKSLEEFDQRSDRPGKHRPDCKDCRRKNHRENEIKQIKARDTQQKPNARYYKYEYYAKKRNLEWSLTFDEFMVFWQAPCYYCGDKHTTIGIDRLDNKQGYRINNVVSCCKICNIAKSDNTFETFLDKCRKIVLKHGA